MDTNSEQTYRYSKRTRSIAIFFLIVFGYGFVSTLFGFASANTGGDAGTLVITLFLWPVCAIGAIISGAVAFEKKQKPKQNEDKE